MACTLLGTIVMKRYIVCAAIKYLMTDPKDDVVVTGARHYDQLMNPIVKSLNLRERAVREIQGFLDQHGKFYDRREALVIATEAGQINTRRPKSRPLDRLFSEDLY